MPRAQLVELYAHGLGVIDDARLEFGSGFNVLTGETGAGKTLLLGALGLCLGRDSACLALRAHHRDAGGSPLRAGRRRSALVARVDEHWPTAQFLERSAVERRGAAQPRRGLIVIHGQHDSLALRNAEEILRLIDDSGDVDTSELADVRRRLRERARCATSLGGDAGARERETEFLAFQLRELDDARLESPDELDGTLEELMRLTALRDGQATVLDVLAELRRRGRRVGPDAIRRRAAVDCRPGCLRRRARRPRRGVRPAREALHELAALADPDAFDPAALERRRGARASPPAGGAQVRRLAERRARRCATSCAHSWRRSGRGRSLA